MQGWFVNCQLEGYGRWNDNNMICEGTFSNGHLEGNGTCKTIGGNGTLYNGNFKEGMRSGYGFFQDENGSTYEGLWLKDRKHGFGI